MTKIITILMYFFVTRLFGTNYSQSLLSMSFINAETFSELFNNCNDTLEWIFLIFLLVYTRKNKLSKLVLTVEDRLQISKNWTLFMISRIVLNLKCCNKRYMEFFQICGLSQSLRESSKVSITYNFLQLVAWRKHQLVEFTRVICEPYGERSLLVTR